MRRPLFLLETKMYECIFLKIEINTLTKKRRSIVNENEIKVGHPINVFVNDDLEKLNGRINFLERELNDSSKTI